jgi:outer membrane protein assembly factor BamB
VKASRKFEKVGRNDIGARTLATPAIADGAIYLRTADRLHKIAKGQ